MRRASSAREIERRRIRQVRRLYVAQRREDRLRASRMLALPARQQLLTARRLRCLLRATQVAGNDRELARARVALDVALGDVGQRPDHDVPAVVGRSFGGMRLELAAEEHVQEQRLDDVVAVMARARSW
mgnify:CR=1 FL=1